MTAPLERKTCGGGKLKRKKWFKAHILWIVGGLWSDLWFNG